jgi:salicylate hydroxylase
VSAANPSIAIAGAGLAGLTLALALLQRGFRVQVFEQAS